MPSVSDTAYPRLKINPSAKELNELYTPKVYELAFARERAIPTRVGRTASGKYRVVSILDHPHAVGENFTVGEGLSQRLGPSPRVWGELVKAAEYPSIKRPKFTLA
jgi:hypothetical protein